MHSLLQVPELLRLIVEKLEKREQACCAQVCRLWSEVTLDALWYETTLLSIARLFAPLRLMDMFSYELEYSPSPQAWSRFESMYSRRVRVLKIGRGGESYALLKGIHEIGPLLLNLRHLEWNAGFRCQTEVSQIVMFLHPGMERCSFTFGMLHDAQQLVALMEAIPLRCPSLVSMVMNVGSKPELVNPFASLAARLNHLTEIKIPSFPDVSKILSALGNRRNLKKLRFDFSNILSQGLSTYVSAVTSLENPLTEGFPSLEVLELPVQEHTTLCPLFQFDTHCLRSIQIDIGSLDGSVSPKPLLQSISRACPSLATFRLGYHHWNFDLRQFKDDVVGLDDLQDILTCSFMTCLDIVVPICLSLSDSDIRVMAQAWPNLHTLTLCSRSSMEKPENAKDLSLCSLFLLTRLCASIRCITLDIDTVASRTPSFQSLSANSTGQVANLEFLNIGRYPLESGDEVAVAKLLGQVCEPECMLKYNIRLEDLDDEDDNWLQEMSSRWETVRTLTRHFSELYSTIRSLELENTSLRSQVK